MSTFVEGMFGSISVVYIPPTVYAVERAHPVRQPSGEPLLHRAQQKECHSTLRALTTPTHTLCVPRTYIPGVQSRQPRLCDLLGLSSPRPFRLYTGTRTRPRSLPRTIERGPRTSQQRESETEHVCRDAARTARDARGNPTVRVERGEGGRCCGCSWRRAARTRLHPRASSISLGPRACICLLRTRRRPCQIPVTFDLRNHSLTNPVRYTFKLSTGSDAPAHS